MLERAGPGPLVVFVTDGLVEHLRRMSAPTRLVSATQRIPRGMDIPAQTRWYVAIFKTMLLDAGARFGWTTTGGLYGYNVGKNVMYWGLQMERPPAPKRRPRSDNTTAAK